MISFSKSVTRKSNEKTVKSVNLKKNQYGMGNEVIKVRIPSWLYNFFFYIKNVYALKKS